MLPSHPEPGGSVHAVWSEDSFRTILVVVLEEEEEEYCSMTFQKRTEGATLKEDKAAS